MKYVIFGLIILLSISSTAEDHENFLAKFVKSAEYSSVKISPTGDYLAVKMPLEGRTALVTLDRKTLQAKFAFRFGEDEHISDFFWANKSRLVFTKVAIEGDSEVPRTYGQVYAGDVDGKRAFPIFGYRTNRLETGSKIVDKDRVTRAWGSVVDQIRSDQDHILVLADEWDKAGADKSKKLIRVNIYTGDQKLITRTPLGRMSYVFNGAGEPVFAKGLDFYGKSKAYQFIDDEWKLLEESHPLYSHSVQYLSSDDKYLYLTRNRNTRALFKMKLSDNSLQEIFRHPTFDFYRVIKNPIDKQIVGVTIEEEKANFIAVEEDHKFTQAYRLLMEAFPKYNIHVTSATSDLNQFVIRLYSDTTPGLYYFFDFLKMKADPLLNPYRWINPDELLKKQKISFAARDGETLHGYLTLPRDTKPAPLVVLVHGGPYGERDTWSYDESVQLYASMGFAVLQVNFRGSSGYGAQYEISAYKKASTLIQNDIIDGTRWAQSLDRVDNQSACIVGWSFGGYSAVMSLTLEPELFNCAIAAAGYYDVERQHERSDYARIRTLSFKVARMHGDDLEHWNAESPIRYLDKIKSPILIVHGGKDTRVPPEQAELLREGLDKLNKPYEWLFVEREGHGFFDEKNRINYYLRAIDFLNRHIHSKEKAVADNE